jgi:hypothetical protein
MFHCPLDNPQGPPLLASGPDPTGSTNRQRIVVMARLAPPDLRRGPLRVSPIGSKQDAL